MARHSRWLIALLVTTACTESSELVTDEVSAELGGYTDSFTLFETGQVRPLALSPDGQHLYVTNTPDNRLEIFRITALPNHPLLHVGSVRVGLEPVAVAVRDCGEVWVVNHLSDSVSVVDVSTPWLGRVVRTLLVGDEPRDIVFAGTTDERAFITTAHRGQNNPNDPQLTTPGIGRADVWVFDADDQGTALGGAPLNIITLFTDTPRALAVSPDRSHVYAAGFLSGNQTMGLHDGHVTNGGPNAPDGYGLPPPTTNFEGILGPETGLILRFDGTHWTDELGRNWDHQVKFNLPDKDVFTIDADASPPAEVPGGEFASVGTVLYGMAVNPVSGKVYVANTEALNEVRFSGPGDFGGHTVQGHAHENRITVLDGSNVLPRRLNKHVDFSQCCSPVPNSDNDRSLALPAALTVTGDGTTLYVAAMGSSKIGVFDTTELENDTFVPDSADHIEVSGGGPAGVLLDEARGQLYVLTRFDNGISIIDTGAGVETHHTPMFNPEPASIVLGRPILYDARNTSGNGTTACGSCHAFGDFDGLGWDLGDPDGTLAPSQDLVTAPPFAVIPDDSFHPMKGPMTTQSLRGMANHGPMHWRGDRNGFFDVPTSAQPDTGLFDENAAFLKFNEAFVSLNGRHAEISNDEMQAFADFILQVTYPPNPIRHLDNSLTAAQARGKDFLVNAISEIGLGGPDLRCVDCHTFDPDGNAEYGVARPGFFGGDGLGLIEGDDFFDMANGNDLQHIKVPHFRNQYQKVGMFGTAFLGNTELHQDNSHQGDQIRGFGFLHDGGTDSIFRFMQVTGFSDAFAPEGFPTGPAGDPLRRDVEAFLLAFDSNLAPIVGQQITLTGSNGATVDDRIDLLIERAEAGECELVASTRPYIYQRGYLYLPSVGLFVPNDHSKPWLPDWLLRPLAALAPITYTCVPPQSGRRIALDADLDGCYDITELSYGYDPRDSTSTPPGC
ncbi:beta-propeller fold lactonase family protein [Haliangium sp.]|uniref:YncE family protein n=1 Tax=Haliangium sp. TaxID=2663208 RepID=UPI003D0EDFD5